jgi:hypothetical protein
MAVPADDTIPSSNLLYFSSRRMPAVAAALARIAFFLAAGRMPQHVLPKLKSQVTEPDQNFMKNTKCLIRKWAGGFAILLAFALITGCQSAKPVSTAENSSAAAAPATETPAAAAPAAAPAAAATTAPATTPAQPAAPAPAAAPAAAAAPTATTTSLVSVTPPVRIKCGVTEGLKDSEGNAWVADEGFADGETYEVEDAEITNTTDQVLYRTERYSMTAYNFAVPNGQYTVKLHFAEVYSGIGGPGDRVFSFNVQGHEFKDFDIWVKAGGFSKAYVESVDVEVTNGTLNITFTPNAENPKINGIEILPRS